MVKLQVRKNAYYDSVTLMILSKDLKKIAGVKQALVGMGTELNRELARSIGLDAPGFEEISANDFFIAVECTDDLSFKASLAKVDEMLNKKSEARKTSYAPPNLSGALKINPAINMALISVPGKFAADLAQSCLDKDINVMLFSDNVTIEEERALKEYGVKHELLVMGPDCGTAIINGVQLAFANVVKSGDIGIVAASGTGAQEVSSLIDRFGGGISQVLGTGGRDLKKEIGGLMMKLCLDALIRDPNTKVLVLVSKPPSKEIASEILEIAKSAGKPTVVCFIGGETEQVRAYGLIPGVSLEDTAYKAVALSKGMEIKDYIGFTMGQQNAKALAKEIAAKFAPSQKYIRGFYTGGTLCDEAMKLMIDKLHHIYSNIPLRDEDKLTNARNGDSYKHTFLDFGDDEFTVGRPHPMIDPSLRAERVLRDGGDLECAIIMTDCVIGYGSHKDPANDLADAIKTVKAEAEASGRYLCCIASVCGTEGDPQSLSMTTRKLEDAGAFVFPSNAQAARFAQLIMEQLKGEG